MRQIEGIRYELSEQEYKEVRNLIRDLEDYFEHENSDKYTRSYKEAKFSIKRLSKIFNNIEK